MKYQQFPFNVDMTNLCSFPHEIWLHVELIELKNGFWGRKCLKNLFPKLRQMIFRRKYPFPWNKRVFIIIIDSVFD